MEVIDVYLLGSMFEQLGVDYIDVCRLLFDLSDVILRDRLQEEVDLLAVLKRTKHETASRKRLAQSVVDLKPIDRLRCCAHNWANVRVVDGRALCLDPNAEGKLLFGDDPVAWIKNGLWAIDWRVLPPQTSFGWGSGWLRPCPAFLIQPCEIPGTRKITTSTIPAINIGTRFTNTVITEWRAGFWLRDIGAGYALSGKKLQAAWLEQVPNASEPDPVCRFIREPSEHLRDEALLFLRQVHDKPKERMGAGGSGQPQNATDASPSSNRTIEPAGEEKVRWYHDQNETRPPEFKSGPRTGYKYELAPACLQGSADHRAFANECADENGGLWVRKLGRSESKFNFEVWFKTERNFEDAKQWLESLRKSKAA
jgi:hypothetical protein